MEQDPHPDAPLAGVDLGSLPTPPAVPRAATPPPGRKGYATVLRNRRFLLYESSAIAATSGYSVYLISIPWLAYTATGSFVVVGVVLFLELGIYSLTFLVAPLVDRLADKRVVFLIGYPIQAAAAIGIAVAASRGVLSLPLLFGLVVVLSVAWDFDWAVFQVAPRMLLSKDELFAGQGIASAFGGGVQVGGYAAGAGLIVLTGAGASGYLYGAFLLSATVLAVFVPLRAGPAAPQRYLEGFREGWAELGRGSGKPLLQLGILDAAAEVFISAPPILITLSADREFSSPALAYGVLFTAYVVGGVASDLTLGQLNPRGFVGPILVGGLCAGAVLLYLTHVFPPSLLLTALVWVGVGAALGAYYSGKWTFVWGSVPEDRLARVTGNLYVFPGVAGALGSILLGVLVEQWTSATVVTAVAAVFGLAAVLSLALPAIRRFAF